MTSRVCPYLGMFDDAETPLAFASPKNTCYRAEPSEAVSLEHQLAHCLSDRYSTCPILLRGQPGPLPPELRLHGALPTWRRLAPLSVGVLIVLVLFYLGLRSLGAQQGLTAPGETVLPGGAPASPVELIPAGLATPTAAALPTDTPPDVNPMEQVTATPAVTLTSVPPPSEAPALDPTACVPPAGWVLYTVRSGDTLFGLSLLVNETVETLQAANCMQGSTLLTAGEQIYLPFLPPPPASATPLPPSPTSTPGNTPVPSPTPSPTLEPTTPPPTDVPTPTNAPPLPTAVPSPTATLLAQTPEATSVGQGS